MPLSVAFAAVSMPLALLLTVALTFLAPGVWWLQVGLWLATLAHQGWLFYTVLLWRAEQIVVTDKRLIRVHGVFTTTVDAVHLNEITDTTYHHSFLGHVFNYGTVRIGSAGKKQSLETNRFRAVPGGDLPGHAALTAPRYSRQSGSLLNVEKPRRTSRASGLLAPGARWVHLLDMAPRASRATTSGQPGELPVDERGVGT